MRLTQIEYLPNHHVIHIQTVPTLPAVAQPKDAKVQVAGSAETLLGPACGFLAFIGSDIPTVSEESTEEDHQRRDEADEAQPGRQLQTLHP